MNITPLKRCGSNVFFAALYCSCLGFMPCLQAGHTMDFNKYIKFKKGAINCCFISKNSAWAYSIKWIQGGKLKL